MYIDYRLSPLLKYGFCQEMIKLYYKRKMGHHCFVMEQNGRWTIVTYNAVH